jgi:glycosyltransferase involved in cell wall biosynthesis
MSFAIESLWAQTFDTFEIIAIEGGSSDATGAILDSLVARSPIPMRVVHGSYSGPDMAMNAGAALASAPYLAFLNDDDAFHVDRLNAFARVINRCSDFAWGFSRVESIDEHGRPIAVSDIPDVAKRRALELTRSPFESVRSMPVVNALVSSGNLVVKTELFKTLDGARDVRFRGWDLALRLLDLSEPFVVERALYLDRTPPAKATRFSRNEDARASARALDHMYREYRDRLMPRHRFGPRVADLGVGDNRPDDERAVHATLWALAKLRSVPLAYNAVRNSARLTRRALAFRLRRR